MQLKKENLGLRAEIQRLRELDDTTRKIIFEAEFKEKLAEKDMKIHHLNGQIDSLSQGDESITQEMESIGQVRGLLLYYFTIWVERFIGV